MAQAWVETYEVPDVANSNSIEYAGYIKYRFGTGDSALYKTLSTLETTKI